MPRLPRPYTHEDYLADCRFLESVRDESGLPIDRVTEAGVGVKRDLLALRYQGRQFHSNAQVQAVFVKTYERATRNTGAVERCVPLGPLFLAERGSFQLNSKGKVLSLGEAPSCPDDNLSERIAIGLDSCTDVELEYLTLAFGNEADAALGGYSLTHP